jgi:superfamily I DNA/RNA helicase
LIKNLYDHVSKQGKDAAVRRGASVLLESGDPAGDYRYEDLVREFGLLASKDQDALSVIKMSEDERMYIQALERRGENIQSAPRIKLSTFHAMKGGEDDNCVVYLGTTIACASNDQDDEHRAFYVGITRTRKALHILDTDRTYRYHL